MTTALVLLGLGCGLGVVLFAAGLTRRRAVLESELRRYGAGAALLHDSRDDAPAVLVALAGMGASLGRLTSSGPRSRRRENDLVITNRTLEGHSVVQAVTTLLGAGVPVLAAGVWRTLGGHVPATGVLVVSVLGAAGGILSPEIELRRSATLARERFLRGLSCWLELVALAQAGGMGVEGALDAAGRVSSEPTFARIRQALERSRHSGVTPWEELARLGAEIGVDELDELAASLNLAGAEGARIRTSLTAKAQSLRRRQMSDAQARANATTERLFLPSIVLMIGFLIFLMFPAGVSLAHVL